jgi:hypothetical protein
VTTPAPPGHPQAIARAENDLRNAAVAALTMYTDGETLVGFTPKVAATLEPSLTYNREATAVPGEISIRDVTRTTVVLVTKTVDGDVFCIAADATKTNGYSYGVTDAQTAAECQGGEAVWESPAPSASSTVGPDPSMSPAQGHGVAAFDAFGSSWTLSAGVDAQGMCMYLTRDDGSVGGTCGLKPSGPSDIEFPGMGVATVAGADYSFVYGLAPAGTESAGIRKADGQGFAPFLFPLPPIVGYDGTAFVFIMELKGGHGTLSFYDASLTQIVSGPVTWAAASA